MLNPPSESWVTTITRPLTYTSKADSTGVQIIFVVGGVLKVLKVSLFVFYVVGGRAWDENMRRFGKISYFLSPCQ